MLKLITLALSSQALLGLILAPHPCVISRGGTRGARGPAEYSPVPSVVYAETLQGAA